MNIAELVVDRLGRWGVHRACPLVHPSTVAGTPATAPPAEDLRRAADVLNTGSRVAMLVGAGALGASDLVEQVAHRLHAGVAKALLGKAVPDDRLEWVTGSIGLLGTASWELMQHCDILPTVGSTMPYARALPSPSQARAVQIDRDGVRCGLHHPTEGNLAGDAATSSAGMLPLLGHRPDDDRWRHRIVMWKQHWDAYSTGVKELITVSRYWRHRADPRFVVLVLNNRQLA